MKSPIQLIRGFLEDIASIRREIQYVGGAMHSLLNKKTDATYVLVLPPNSLMLGQMHYVPPGTSMQVTFSPILPIPKGSWIIAFGPAKITDVRVGNQSQVVYPGTYPAVITLDEAFPGQLIIAMLEAPK